VGVVQCGDAAPNRATPLPSPPPQGGREQTECVAPLCINLIGTRASLDCMHQLESGCETWKVYRFPLSIFIPKTLMRALHVNSDRMRALVVAIGLDIAKRVFQVHGVDSAGAVVVRKKLRR
jgi:hypothetical protein